MAMKLMVWDEERTKLEVPKRYKYCLDDRLHREERWMRNEHTIFSTSAGSSGQYLQKALQDTLQSGLPGVNGSDADMVVAYVFKNYRFIHAQMSANPPSVAMRPTSSDQEDHRKADAADRIVRWAIRHYSMQEKVDNLSQNALLYGTGLIKTIWDSSKGDIIGFDSEKDEVRTDGDIAVTVPFIWNIFIDPDAKCWEDVKYVIERIYMDYDEACVRWPDKKDILQKARIERGERSGSESSRQSQLDDKHYNAVELLEYWERGLPTNGYLGRFCITTTDGESVEPCRPSPFRFKQSGSITRIEQMDIPDEIKERMISKIPEQAGLPYHILTDVDIPNTVWGRSFIEYAAQLQDNLNRIDTAYMDNIQAHSAARMVVTSDTEVEEMGNSTWDVTKVASNQPPYFMAPPQAMPDMSATRMNLVAGINEVSGVNESMFGQQSREQSGASMQYATNQGNMIRRRLFNKYVLAVESVYKGILNLIRKHWTVSRTICVLGKEKALEAVDVKGADIDGGYDVIGEYGVTLSLDPITRREEILTMQPLFKEAGVPARKALQLLKLNELEGAFDEIDLADTRQKEIFDEMIASGRYIPPEDLMDHENMIAFGMRYFMSQEFNILDGDVKQLLKQHIRERAQLAASEKPGGANSPTPGSQVPGAAPGPLPGQPAGEVPAPAGAPAPLPG